MLGLIEIVFSSIGVYGYFTQNLICVILGLIGIIVCDFIDIFVTGHNPTIVFLATTFGIGVSIANKNPLYGFTIALCGENLIISFITIFIMGVSFIMGHLKKNKSTTSLEFDKYIELSKIVMKGLNVEYIDEAISKTYTFYKEQGIDVESIQIDNNDKFATLSKLVMLALDTDNIDEAIQETTNFYNSQENKENENI